ncbi:MAG TPA: hypothetical protein PKC95_00120 [Thauera aminoaromatica]|nr:hypothetical protein [Thauera aminoaromatica]
MALAQAQKHLARVQIVGRAQERRWHPLWEGSNIARLGEVGDFPAIVNGPGCRPYVDYRRSTKDRWAFTAWRCRRARLPALSPDPRAAGTVLIEPHLKPTASPNKQWGRWAELVASYPEVRWAQPGNAGTRWLPGVEPLETRDFTDACRLLLACDSAVLPEGALHHAAAALGRRVVVLFGGMIRPANTGYDEHINLAVDDPEAVGWRVRHPACARAWSRITPDVVRTALESARKTPS